MAKHTERKEATSTAADPQSEARARSVGTGMAMSESGVSAGAFETGMAAIHPAPAGESLPARLALTFPQREAPGDPEQVSAPRMATPAPAPAPSERDVHRLRKQARARLRRLIERDGLACAFCGEWLVASYKTVPGRVLRFDHGSVTWRDRKGRERTDLLATIEHVIPLAAGGSNAIDNLKIACSPCNQARAVA